MLYIHEHCQGSLSGITNQVHMAGYNMRSFVVMCHYPASHRHYCIYHLYGNANNDNGCDSLICHMLHIHQHCQGSPIKVKVICFINPSIDTLL